MTPTRIHLEHHPELRPGASRHLTGALVVRGFWPLASYVVSELDDVRLFVFDHADEPGWAVAYEHPEAGVFCDLYVQYDDGRSLTVSSAPSGHEMEVPPSARKIFDAEADVDGLLERFRAECEPVAYGIVNAERFAAIFEQAWADEMDWRLQRGPSGSELEAVAVEMGVELDAETHELAEFAEMLGGVADRLERVAPGSSKVHEAVAEGAPEKLAMLLEEGEAFDEPDMQGQRPIHLAATSGRPDLVEPLIHAGAQLDRRQAPESGNELFAGVSAGRTPLMLAAQAGSADVVARLVEAGAAVDLRIDAGETFTAVSDVISENREAEQGAAMRLRDEGASALHLAARGGHAEVVHALIGAGASLDVADGQGDTPLVHAVRRAHEDCAAALRQAGASEEGSASASLVAAVRGGEFRHTRALLGEGGDANALDRDAEGGEQPLLHLAVRAGDRVLLKLLLASGADVDGEARSEQFQGGRTALHWAAEAGDCELIEPLLHAGADPNRRDGRSFVVEISGQTPLLIATRGNALEAVEMLLSVGAKPDGRGSEGDSPLCVAVEAGHADVARILLGAGARADRKGEQSPLVAAAGEGQLECVKMLIEAGADPAQPSGDAWSPITAACSHGHTEVVRLLIESGATPNESKASLTPFGVALMDGCEEVVALLLESGLDPNVRDESGSTALNDAIMHGRGDLVARLLEMGAHANVADEEGATPLLGACNHEDLEVARMLLDAGADPNQRDGEGSAPLDIARDGESPELVSLLQSRGAEPGEPHQDADEDSDDETDDISSMRGVASFDGNDSTVMVRASVEAVAEKLKELREADVWQQDAYGEEVELTHRCFRVYRFAGQDWTLIEDEFVHMLDRGRIGEEDAQALSEALQAPSLFFYNSDTAGCGGYQLFGDGRLVERLDYGGGDFEEAEDWAEDDEGDEGDDLRFESMRRELTKEQRADPYGTIDAMVREIDAFAPCISGGFGGEAGESRTLRIGGLEDEDFERMDFVACS
jgi:ankyrin repeat protein